MLLLRLVAPWGCEGRELFEPRAALAELATCNVVLPDLGGRHERQRYGDEYASVIALP